jgi:hypothetical protein
MSGFLEMNGMLSPYLTDESVKEVLRYSHAPLMPCGRAGVGKRLETFHSYYFRTLG